MCWACCPQAWGLAVVFLFFSQIEQEQLLSVCSSFLSPGAEHVSSASSPTSGWLPWVLCVQLDWLMLAWLCFFSPKSWLAYSCALHLLPCPLFFWFIPFIFFCTYSVTCWKEVSSSMFCVVWGHLLHVNVFQVWLDLLARVTFLMLYLLSHMKEGGWAVLSPGAPNSEGWRVLSSCLGGSLCQVPMQACLSACLP